MSFLKSVDDVKERLKNLDTHHLDEHIALEVRLDGADEGTFYIELDKEKINIEPYEYKDNDAVIKAKSNILMRFISKKLDIENALVKNTLKIDGNINKVFRFYKLIKNK